MRVSTFLVFSIVACTLVHGVYSLECYVCSGCNDPFKAEGVTKVKCNGSCSKGKTTGKTDVIARACHDTSMTNGCEKASAGGVTAEICYCDKDLCNTGTSQYASMGLAAFTFTLIVTIRNSIIY